MSRRDELYELTCTCCLQLERSFRTSYKEYLRFHSFWVYQTMICGQQHQMLLIGLCLQSQTNLSYVSEGPSESRRLQTSNLRFLDWFFAACILAVQDFLCALSQFSVLYTSGTLWNPLCCNSWYLIVNSLLLRVLDRHSRYVPASAGVKFLARQHNRCFPWAYLYYVRHENAIVNYLITSQVLTWNFRNVYFLLTVLNDCFYKDRACWILFAFMPFFSYNGKAVSSKWCLEARSIPGVYRWWKEYSENWNCPQNIESNMESAFCSVSP